MPSKTIFTCIRCSNEFSVSGLYNDQYVTCPHCKHIIDVAEYFKATDESGREWQDEHDTETDYDKFLEDDEPD